MAGATERVVVLMSPEQKADVSERARASKLSLGDYMRRSALGDDAVLTALVEQLKESTRETMATVDQALSRMDERERTMAEHDAAIRRRAEAEFADIDLDAVTRVFTPAPSAEAPTRRETAAR